MNTSEVYKLKLALELFERDRDPKTKIFYKRLFKVHNRIFENKKLGKIVCQYRITKLFSFYFFMDYFSIKDEDFLEQVYKYSHDKQFQDELIEAYDNLFWSTIQSKSLPMYLRVYYRFLTTFEVSWKFVRMNPMNSLIIFTNVLNFLCIMYLNTVAFGIIGFLLTGLLIFVLVLWIASLIDRFL